MPTLFLFLSTSLGRWLALLAGAAVLVVSWRVSDVHKQRAVGAEKAVAQVEKANTDAIRKARLVPLLLPLALTACAIQTPSPTSPTVALEAFKPISNSPKAPCLVQKEISEHNSVYETIRSGKETVYLAPCVADGKHILDSAGKPHPAAKDRI
jgi:hypothetical protein